MSKGLIMSAVITALSGNASASVDSAFAATNNFRENPISRVSNMRVNENQGRIKQTQTVVNHIKEEIQRWRDLANDIEASENPVSFFSEEEVAELDRVDLYVRYGEQMLRLQYEDLVRHSKDKKMVDSLKSLRKAIAQLRSSISNVVLLEKQYHPAKASEYVEQFDMSTEKLAMLKEATQAAYYH